MTIPFRSKQSRIYEMKENKENRVKETKIMDVSEKKKKEFRKLNLDLKIANFLEIKKQNCEKFKYVFIQNVKFK